MPKVLIAIYSLLILSAANATQDQERLIYIMSEMTGPEVVDQCTRTVYYPDVFWRVTKEQVEAIEKRLTRYLQNEDYPYDFKPLSITNYKRQYIGFKIDGESFIYGNFFPRSTRLENDPVIEGIVSCRSDSRYWGMLFSIDKFSFTSIERNDKLVKPRGAIDPRFVEPELPPEQ